MGRIFWEEFFGRNYLLEINKELMFLSRFWGNAGKDKNLNPYKCEASSSHLKIDKFTVHQGSSARLVCPTIQANEVHCLQYIHRIRILTFMITNLLVRRI